MNRLLTRPLIALFVVMGLLSTACAGGDTRDAEDVVRDSIRSSETQPRRFQYIDETPEVTYSVSGVYEDDFRYQVAFSIDGELVYEEVVQDDRIAVRVHDERALELLRRPDEAEELEGEIGGIVGDITGEGTDGEGTDGEGTDGEGTDGEGTGEEDTGADTTGEGAEDGGAEVEAAAQDDVTPVGEEGELTDEEQVEELLLSGVWVEDVVGAPSLLPSATTPDIGEDPVYDALTVLRYTQSAMMEGWAVDRYDPDSITYRPQEDPFEPPSAEDGEYERWDYERIFLPSKSQVNESGQQQPPSMSHLRKMVLYLDEDGHVIRVEEQVDIRRRLKDLREKYDIIPPEGMSEDEQAFWALEKINFLRGMTGEDPIRFRSLSVRFDDVGDESLTVQMPTGTTITSLLVLRNRGSETGRPPEPPEEGPDDGDDVADPEVAPPADGDG
ncbi:MAG TPA: hypothetical protein VGA69_06490 [Nitriliruptorales bacterium]